ncbi:hypothetical protein V6N13_123331 [Hibiscus sabdariffa]
MMRLAKDELKVELNKNMCQRARVWANQKIRGKLEDEFNKLFDYVYTLREADPNGTFDLFVQRPTPSANPIFRRLYVCFGGLKEGFNKHCRPILSLDGCYLKGDFKGEILATVGRDENNQIFPVTWAVVEVENRETWAWFLDHIQMDLEIGDGDRFTIFSDMQKDVALSSLLKRDPKHWSKAFFRTHSKCDAVDNNFGEAFNSAIISTRYWDLTGIPCSHSICVIMFNYEPLERYVDEAYRKESYQSLYHYALPTIPSEAFWKDTKMGPLEPPVKRKLPGRPKQKRKREEGETTKGFKLSKRGSKCTCRCCGSQQTQDSISLQPEATDVSQPPAPNPSQPATTDVSQPLAPNPSQPGTSQASQPQFPNSGNTSTKIKAWKTKSNAGKEAQH